ncbi:uncharacterized protein LOC111868691 isoform X1 [Cryptotermes secundus]|uniref:uncharacterized protein LOC111868691 isoform X1 n=2 Tax=Cryptotermes secundus TaxID=105785 RepID=UPI000CD7CCB5|nr:uncharacterized protein LOC111868691 isoform X1 [Cryptotermes secundus]XP_033609094.1 uncharacterized protein LOC111868691 isoform X1 [Cryptotermes secundus]
MAFTIPLQQKVDMRRASYTPLPTQAPAEPLIVVEESGGTDDEETPSRESSPQLTLHPGLLSPYRDMRKRSLPTPSCTSGITASQVRRLSEHGVEGRTAASMREAAFLATLSSAPAPAPGGRRHSVVTISRAPPPSILFGRGRRESIAAFPANSMQVTRVLANRRDSTSSVPRPPSTSGSTSGSQFNLQLDIMDDIAEIKAARKVRLKMWKTPSHERVCEVQPLDGTPGTSASATRYHQVSAGPSSRPDASATTQISRRYSDFVPTQPAQHPKRRASEQVPPSSSGSSATPPKPSPSTGIICSNTDLISIISSLASSAQEINKDPGEESPSRVSSSTKGKDSSQGAEKSESSSSASAEEKRNRLRNLRSNSFDVSMLLGAGVKPKQDTGRCSIAGPASWFVKRHQPKKSEPPKGQSPVMGSLFQEKANASVAQSSENSSMSPESGQQKTSSKTSSPPDNKVLWDEKSGSVVDAQVLGSAIEVFLARRGSGNDSPGGTSPQSSKVSPTKNNGKTASGSGVAGTSSWFSGNKDAEDEAGSSDTCDTSLCSTLKDLFVK